MKRKWIFALGFLIAAAIAAFVPQLIVQQAEGSAGEVTYQFQNMGVTSSESRQELQSILENIVGINRIDIHPTMDQVTVTFDEETMKAEWIAKSLKAHGYGPEHYQKLKSRN